jgi:hypothetical protein
LLSSLVPRLESGKGQAYASIMEGYFKKLAIYNRGAGIPLGILWDATLVIQLDQQLLVWKGSQFQPIELEPQQDTRMIFYPKFDGVPETRFVFC